LSDRLFEHEVGQLLELRKCIGRVGEDEVIGTGCLVKETEDISAQEGDVILATEGLQKAANEGDVLGIELYGGDMRAAAGQEFEGDAARAGKEIQGAWGICLEVDVGTEDIEEVLLGEVGSGPRLEGSRDIKMASAVFASNDTHRLTG
jgi:hypothetical protein